jgi:uncharacterized linocin/CFP29 family protein
MPQFNMDTLSLKHGRMVGAGPVAERMLKGGFNVNALRTNDILSKDEWKLFDDKVVEIARRRLVGVGALLSRGLRFNVANALGVTQIEWEQLGDLGPAHLSMSGVTEGDRDRLTWTLKSMPLPIFHKDFSLNIRQLTASRNNGQGVDTMQAELCTRIISEAIETLLFSGSTMSVLGGTIPGLLTEANRNTGTSANWHTNATGTEKVADLIEAIDLLSNDNMYGPYGVFVGQTAFNNLADDYKAESDKTQLARLLEIPGIEFILPSKDLTGKNILVVQLTRDVVEEVVGFQPTMVMWEGKGGLEVNFKIMAIMVPRVRSTKTGQSGIVHLS